MVSSIATLVCVKKLGSRAHIDLFGRVRDMQQYHIFFNKFNIHLTIQIYLTFGNIKLCKVYAGN